ncbi:DnaD domain protein [Helcococcus ovis]|uniref:DnaD domain protein n=1 Tax=Helcococcus ovis TaxID=72026 RepID=UPI0038BBE3E5
MRLEIEQNIIDLGTTPIENMFINTYLSFANDVQIKVYLYALSVAYCEKQEISNANIAVEMKLTEGQVVDAWQYWIDQGLVEQSGDKYIFKSVRTQYLQSMYGTNDHKGNSFSKSSFEKEQMQKEEIYNNSSESIESRELIENIEEFISQGQDIPRKLNPREIKKVLGTMNDFGVSCDFISYAYMMASNIRGVKAVDQIMATIRNWMIDGATNIEKLEKYLEQKENKEKENKAEIKNNKSQAKKVSLADKDDRMSKEERLKFVQEKMKKKLPTRRRK